MMVKAANPKCYKDTKSFSVFTFSKFNKKKHFFKQKGMMTTTLFNEQLLNLDNNMKKQKPKILVFRQLHN